MIVLASNTDHGATCSRCTAARGPLMSHIVERQFEHTPRIDATSAGPQWPGCSGSRAVPMTTLGTFWGWDIHRILGIREYKREVAIPFRVVQAMEPQLLC
jgi:hypothetical protein